MEIEKLQQNVSKEEPILIKMPSFIAAEKKFQLVHVFFTLMALFQSLLGSYYILFIGFAQQCYLSHFHVYIWTLLTAIHSLVVLIYYLTMIGYFQNSNFTLRVATAMGFVRLSNVDPPRKPQKISNFIFFNIEMKYVSFDYSDVIQTFGTLQFLGYQFIFCYFIYVVFNENIHIFDNVQISKTQDCQTMANYGLYVFGMGLVLYYEFYSVIVIIGLLPLFGIYYFFAFLTQQKQEKQVQNDMRPIIYKTFQNEIVESTLICQVCSRPMESHQDIIKLSCGKQCAFHQSCIQNWLQYVQKCPVCQKIYN